MLRLESSRMSVLLPTICSNQDLVKTLFERNPNECRNIARKLGLGLLPDDLKSDSIDLEYICENRKKENQDSSSMNLLSDGKC